MVDDTRIREDLIARLPLTEFAQADREEIVVRLIEHILTKVNLIILEQMSEEVRRGLLECCDAGDDTAVIAYITRTVGSLDPIIKEATVAVVSQFKVKLHGAHS